MSSQEILEETIEEAVERVEDLIVQVEDLLPHTDISEELRDLLKVLNQGVGYNE